MRPFSRLAPQRAIFDAIRTFAHCELVMRQGSVHPVVDHQREIPAVIFWKRSWEWDRPVLQGGGRPLH